MGILRILKISQESLRYILFMTRRQGLIQAVPYPSLKVRLQFQLPCIPLPSFQSGPWLPNQPKMPCKAPQIRSNQPL